MTRGLVWTCMFAILTTAPTTAWAQPAPDKPAAAKVDPNADYSDELPRIPPKSPADSLKEFSLLDGFRIDLVAAEPLVVDPVAIDFDARGRAYVVEMRGYSEDDDKLLGRVRLLEDTDGDGAYDKSTVFADGLSWPTAIICYDDGAFVGAAPDILYFKDTTGDGKADRREVAFTGFGRSNVQGLLNSFRWGLDNRIHGATSSSGGSVRAVHGKEKSKPVELRGRDFAFDPRTRAIEPTSGGAQHGLSFDDWGRKFVCSNSSHIQMVLLEDRYLRRNPHLPAPSSRKMIAVDGGQAEVFRQSPVEPWRIVRTRLRVAGAVRGPVEGGGRAAGYFTGSTGVTIFRGDAWPEENRGLAFIGDVGSNIVHRKRLVPDGVAFEAVRVDEGREFLSSREIWFRPVQFANAPDGCLWVLDMYREVIEHPKSLPPVIKKHLDLTSGRDRGRLYRIAPEGFRPPSPPQLDERTTSELVGSLTSPNGWIRDTAARLLYERQDRSSVAPLRKLVREGRSPLGRMHALYALDGLDALTPEVVSALADENARVREHAVRLAERVASNTPAVREALYAMTEDPDLRVRYQLAFTLGDLSGARRIEALAKIAGRDAGEDWMRLAVLSSLSSGAGAAFERLVGDAEFRRSAEGRPFVSELARMIGAQNQRDSLALTIRSLEALPEQDRPLAASLFRELSGGLGKSGSPLRAALASAEGGADAVLDDLLADARRTAADEAKPPAARAEAARTLALSSFEAERDLLGRLLESRQPREAQLAALEAMSRFTDAGVAPLVLSGWSGYSPSVRAAAAELLFARTERLTALLDAVAEGLVKPTQLDPNRVNLLRLHRNENIRRRAKELFAESQLGRREDVVAAYRDALTVTGDPQRGEAAFKKTCAACHKVEGLGHEMGPNLAAMKNRGPEAILVNVLDPNREVNPQYLNYALVTADGRSLTGMIAGETATSVTLRRGENKTDTVLRKDIDVLQSTGLSIMPEGMEKELSVQTLADLIAYLLSAK